uniref:Uncharacterized protein n=1 Tax=Anopheles christyi TaxID=43041 RepID=A0A182KJ55_9DIPT
MVALHIDRDRAHAGHKLDLRCVRCIARQARQVLHLVHREVRILVWMLLALIKGSRRW